ncbi:MAG: ATP synthase F0 subunit B [bacterium]|nr:hypothetical protein [Deltaproteobacteria bacterium]MCP4241052.1 ATP synthase F0 subunit B [bacterium]MDP6076352.1 ATP synthase F0 subunit B [Myxococcota bacterium]MDP6242080.1 ATP synthase F0 subunit B [Myxococcota bacterium]MDP7074124.1 ATP synthase F0 subunit B [Myxococcota bacterium]
MPPPSRWTRHLTSFLLAIFALGLCLAQDAAASDNGLELIPDHRLLIGLVIFFVLLIFPVNTLLFQPIFAALEARRERIEGTRARAEELEAEAKAALTRYEHAVQQVRNEAEQARKATLASARAVFQNETQDARAETESTLDNARQEIGRELESARETLGQRADALAREAAATVLGRSLT